MSTQSFPFAVRLIGFSPAQEASFEAACASGTQRRFGYFRLDGDNLLDPDFYLVNADDPRALTALPSLNPGPVRPALLIGTRRFDLPFPSVTGAVDAPAVFVALDKLVLQRADVMSRLQASDIVIVPERRRRPRLEQGDPAEYEKMRVKRPERGAILVVDKTPAFRDYLDELMSRYRIPVRWVDSEADAVDLYRRELIAIAMVNTSMPEVDPYRLCWALKEKDDVKTTVVMLVGAPDEYNTEQARYVGADGYLVKPVLPQHLLSAIKKFLPLR